MWVIPHGASPGRWEPQSSSHREWHHFTLRWNLDKLKRGGLVIQNCQWGWWTGPILHRCSLIPGFPDTPWGLSLLHLFLHLHIRKEAMILASQSFYNLMLLPKLVGQIESSLQPGYCASAWSLSRLRKVKVGSLLTLHPAALVSSSFHSIPKPHFQLLGTEIQKNHSQVCGRIFCYLFF